MSLNSGSRDILRRIVLVCGAITASVGALVLVAWALGWGALTAMVTGYYPVAPTAALLFAVLGSAMLVREFWPASRGMHRAATAAGLFGAAAAGAHACLAKQDMYTQLLPVLRQQIEA